jgi:hypothetical protein
MNKILTSLARLDPGRTMMWKERLPMPGVT